MILFFARGKVDSDKFVKFCYGHYRDIMARGDMQLPREIAIIREDGKKPRFDRDDVHFNLSHSHGVVMLAISHSPIGVDIEKVRDIDYKKIDFVDADDVDDFFEKWTMRESYLKFTGEGLKKMRCEIPSDAHFEHFPVYDDYIACVCAEEQNIMAYEIDINAVNET